MAARLLSQIPSFPYPPARDGRWSPVTSTLDWCEENYYATPYSAEIVNTLTNLSFMYLASKGIRSCLKNGHDQVFLIAYVGYLLVGTGSFLFHSTLKYPMQLVDELSMIYTTCLMSYASLSYKRSGAFRIMLAVSLISLSLFVTLYYHYLQDPTFHQVAYAALTAFIFFRSMYVMEVNLRTRFQSEQRRAANPRVEGGVDATVQRREDRRDFHILRKMWVMIGWGLSVFLGGFALWQLDNIYCSTLRRWRHQIGLPWGILLEGHGWWHLMTGYGAYMYIVWNIWLRHCLDYRQDEFELVWPRVFSMPVVERRHKAYANGHAEPHQNGSTKKEN